jgi:alkylhydroperoxidase family enzyme
MGVSLPDPPCRRRYTPSVPFPTSLNATTHANAQCIDVTDNHVTAVLKSPPHKTNEGVLSDAHAAVLTYTDAMTLNVTVPDAVFARLKESFNEREVVEITATIAAYNCVSRFLVALDVGERNAQEGPREGGKE